jgi:hypothetical protein
MDRFVVLYQDSVVTVVGTEAGAVEAYATHGFQDDGDLQARLSETMRVTDATGSPDDAGLAMDEDALERLRDGDELEEGAVFVEFQDPLGRQHTVLASYQPARELWVLLMKAVS